ncbi:hypothetical protein CRUP_001497 [Coryphaenoides rupestris]|nr:hypothetical protein CRUP_001497 [Coryphaenoides rupestris]
MASDAGHRCSEPEGSVPLEEATQEVYAWNSRAPGRRRRTSTRQPGASSVEGDELGFRTTGHGLRGLLLLHLLRRATGGRHLKAIIAGCGGGGMLGSWPGSAPIMPGMAYGW